MAFVNDQDLALEVLHDKQTITELLHLYCRSVDRADWDTLAGLYWGDAIDHHGIRDGNPGELIQWLKESVGPGLLFEWMIHQLGNVLIEVHGDTAVVESYFSANQRRNGEDGVWDDLCQGRYVDRFERRDGEWRVAERFVMYDWSHSLPAQPAMWEGYEGAFYHSQNAPEDKLFEMLRLARGTA